MKRLLAAACAAVLLTGTLTACGSTRNTYDTNGMTGTNGTTGTTGTTGTAAGTTYSAPGQVRYPAGADEDRDTYQSMLGSQTDDNGTSDGRYTAYSNGTVSAGHGSTALNGNSLGQDLANGTRDVVHGVGDAVEDVGTGVGNAARDLVNG